ncbi:helix-turn-helix domain-containing protein [Gluconobacter wancherniae]|uniref:helix-turn-helix domain-containing protein n=1 Tax=Gluconobacter wancherniae TaxID=1307955 RepID=UPI001B8D173D|nr:helix-turn-helix domain-containing protein [Gluconobacter wancherniae]MBS1063184.1 helix-turn-helix domain-containing protein [Gluconobacter wancherniae]MBS1089027.1 helix-turn-helix domain-containing protein [Gluconobacter wancherniae]
MSPVSSDRTKAYRPDQPTVGQTLRARREELGWQIDAVAEWLRIRPRLLIALEADDVKALPGVAYAVGFLRTYAHSMQLDAEELVARFNRETRGATTRKTDLVFPQPEDDRSIPVGLLVGAGLIVVVAAYAGWYRFAAHDVPAERKVPAVSELMSGAASLTTTSPQVASVMPGRAPAPQHDVAPVQNPAADTPPVSSNTAVPVQAQAGTTVVQPEVPQSQALPHADVPAVADTDHPSTPSELPAPASGVPSSIPDDAVVVRALSSVWTQIKDHDGHVLVGRTLNPGESWQGDASGAPYVMSFGNAGGVVLSAGGITSEPLGKQGAVRRNVTVTADAIRSGAFGTGVPLPVQPQPPLASGPASGPALDGSPPSEPAVTVPSFHRRPSVKPPVLPKPEVSADDLNARQLDQSSPSH